MEDKNIEQSIMDIFMRYLSPEPLYAFGNDFAFWVSVAIAPIFITLAIAIRLAGDGVDTITGKANWLNTLRDFTLGILFWGAYLGIMSLLKDFFDILDNGIGKSGAYEQIFNTMANLTKSVENQESFGWREALSAPSLVISYLFFFVSYLLSLSVFCFLNIGHAAIYSVAFVWGIVAISVSISKHANLMKGWGIMMATALVWPVIEGLLFFLAGAMIESAANKVSTHPTTGMAGTEYGAKTFIYSLWGVLNFLVMALAFAAPLLTYALISNSGSITGAVASFGAAGIAAGVGAAGKMALNRAVRRSGKEPKALASGAPGVNGPKPSPQGEAPAQEHQGGQPTPSVSSSGSNTSSPAASTTTNSTSVERPTSNKGGGESSSTTSKTPPTKSNPVSSANNQPKNQAPTEKTTTADKPVTKDPARMTEAQRLKAKKAYQTQRGVIINNHKKAKAAKPTESLNT